MSRSDTGFAVDARPRTAPGRPVWRRHIDLGWIGFRLSGGVFRPVTSISQIDEVTPLIVRVIGWNENVAGS